MGTTGGRETPTSEAQRVSEQNRRLECFPKRTHLGGQLWQTKVAQVTGVLHRWGGGRREGSIKRKGGGGKEEASFLMILRYEPHVNKLHNKNTSHCLGILQFFQLLTDI